MSWRDVEIKECGEPLIQVRDERIVWASAYLDRYSSALPDIWLRFSAAERLVQAAALLPVGFTLVLWDGWRPIELQRELYQDYRADIARGGLSGEELERETQKFVALPSDNPLHPSPHLTGGAIDLTLGDSQGNPLPMGGEFDELGERSRALFYEQHGPAVFRERRRLLREVMFSAGWSIYPEEWWHFNWGNQYHHHHRGGVARYGPAALSGHPVQ